MSRYTHLTNADEAEGSDGDGAFLGVNLKMDPATLAPGMGRNAVNKRFRKRVADTRPGIITPKFANMVSYGTIFGEGVWNDPNGARWILLAVADGVWMIRDGMFPNKAPLNGGQTVNGAVDMVQAFNQMLMFRGTNQDELQWNGGLYTPWQEISQTGVGGAIPIPNAGTGTNFGNRMLVPFDQDQMAVSDILNYTRYDNILDSFKFNEGAGDKLVRVFPNTLTSIFVFKSQSIFEVDNFYGNLSQTIQYEVDREIGLIARDAVFRLGSSVGFLTQGGIYTIDVVTGTIQFKVNPVPLSDPISPLMDRINWAAAGGAQAATLEGDDYVYLAVPLDGSTVNNAVLVYNKTTQQWEGYDTWTAAFQIDRFLVSDYQGKERIFAVDRAHGLVGLMYEGDTDLIGGVEYQIQDEFFTRGYLMGSKDYKKFQRVMPTVRTWNPSFTIDAVMEGVNAVKNMVTNRTKNRTKYYQFAKPDYDPSNVNGDFLTPLRQDYSVTTVIPFQSNSGVLPETEQEVEERFPVGMVGRHAGYRIRNNQGRLALVALRTEGSVNEKDVKVKP